MAQGPVKARSTFTNRGESLAPGRRNTVLSSIRRHSVQNIATPAGTPNNRAERPRPGTRAQRTRQSFPLPIARRRPRTAVSGRVVCEVYQSASLGGVGAVHRVTRRHDLPEHLVEGGQVHVLVELFRDWAGGGDAASSGPETEVVGKSTWPEHLNESAVIERQAEAEVALELIQLRIGGRFDPGRGSICNSRYSSAQFAIERSFIASARNSFGAYKRSCQGRRATGLLSHTVTRIPLTHIAMPFASLRAGDGGGEGFPIRKLLAAAKDYLCPIQGLVVSLLLIQGRIV